MNIRQKVALSIASGLVLAGTAIATPLAAYNANMQDAATQGQATNKDWVEMASQVSSDEKFTAVASKLSLTDNEQYSSQLDAFLTTIPEGVVGDVYKALPGTKAVMASLEESDTLQKQRIEDKTLSKINALKEAKQVCAMTSGGDVSAEAKKNFYESQSMMKNLAVYLDYCESVTADS